MSALRIASRCLRPHLARAGRTSLAQSPLGIPALSQAPCKLGASLMRDTGVTGRTPSGGHIGAAGYASSATSASGELETLKESLNSLLVDLDEATGVVTLTLHRPKQLNALNSTVC